MSFKVNEKPYERHLSKNIFDYLNYSSGNSILQLHIDHIRKMFEDCKSRRDITTIHRFMRVFGLTKTIDDFTNRNRIWTFTSKNKIATLYALVSSTGCLWECDKKSNKKELTNLFKLVLKQIENKS